VGAEAKIRGLQQAATDADRQHGGQQPVKGPAPGDRSDHCVTADVASPPLAFAELDLGSGCHRAADQACSRNAKMRRRASWVAAK
jgi:hypothetical protein